MGTTRTCAGPLLLCVLAAGALWGHPGEALPFEEEQAWVTSASRAPTPRERVASSVTVITRQELEQRQVRFVSDALRAVPGVAVSRTGAEGGLTQVRMRGAEGNHTLVLLDGIEISDPYNSELDFGNLRAGDIERIEVLRGPESVLYGSEAIGGVINLVTRRAEQGFHSAGLLEAGSLRTRSGRMRVEGGSDLGSFTLNADGTWTTGGYDAAQDRRNNEKDGFREYTLSSRLALTPGGIFSMDGSFRLTRSRKETDGFDFVSNLPADSDASGTSKQFYGIANARLELLDGKLESRVSGAYTDSDRRSKDPTAFPGSPETFRGKRIKLELQNTLTLDDRNRLVLGAETEQEQADDDAGNIDNTSVWTAGYYAQYELTLLENLHLGAGLRIDDNQRFGTHPTYRLTAVYRVPQAGTRLKATWGTAFTAPTMSDRFYQSSFFVGNPDLDPEQSRGFDLGIEQTLLQDRVRVDVTYFENRIKDLIVTEEVVPWTLWSTSNVEQTLARGIEVGLALRPLAGLEITGAYTFTNARNRDTHERLVRRPPHVASLVVDYRFLDRADLDLGIYLNGRQRDVGSAGLAGYTLVNLGLGWDLSDGIQLFARVENLFNKEYQEVLGYDSLPRTATGGIRVRF